MSISLQEETGATVFFSIGTVSAVSGYVDVVAPDQQVYRVNGTISFVTDLGVFSNGEQEFTTMTDSNGVASVGLRSNQPGTAHPSAGITNDSSSVGIDIEFT